MSFITFSMVAAVTIFAQPPKGAGMERGGRGGGVDGQVARLFKFDANGDGKLTKEEVGDERLFPLLARADADGDGFVTKAELTALLTKESAGQRGMGRGRGGPPGGRPGGIPPNDDGPAPRGGPGGPPRPGQILPEFLQEELELTAAQKKQIDALQKQVDAKLEKILTAEQLQRMRDRRSGPDFGAGPGGPPTNDAPTR